MSGKIGISSRRGCIDNDGIRLVFKELLTGNSFRCSTCRSFHFLGIHQIGIGIVSLFLILSLIIRNVIGIILTVIRTVSLLLRILEVTLGIIHITGILNTAVCIAHIFGIAEVATGISHVAGVA